MTGNIGVSKCMNGNLESLCISVLDKTRHLGGIIMKNKRMTAGVSEAHQSLILG